jgi:tetratricopeptide (TPR) repeat protein
VLTAVFCVVVAGALPAAAEDRKSLLLLPVASGTPGQGWSAQALGGILEDGFGSLRSVRLVTGTAREVALRELSASAAVTSEAFREICRRAGADFAVLGGSTLVEGRLALEIRTFDVASGRELLTYNGEEPATRAFPLVEAAVRHVAEKAGLGEVQSLFPRGVTVSLEAYAAYRAAQLEQSPATRIEKLRAVLKLDADYADPTRLLGVELFRLGSLDEALGVLERAAALGPKVAEARNNLGVALAAAGRAEKAQREFEEAVTLAPDYAEARLNLARVLEERSLFSDAQKQYEAILEADAQDDKARSGLAALYDRTGRVDLAVKEFRLLSARRPDLAEGEFILAGQEARKAREYARAEKFFQRAAEINPQFAPAWAELGTNSFLAGEYAKGAEQFRKALTIDPGQAAYHYYLGLALDKGGQHEEALREYRRAVELGGPPEARLGLARAALESGDPGLAVEELNRLLVASPEHAEAKVLLAKATAEMEARRRLVESQSQFANQRLARLEQIVADANRANRELEARLQAVTQEKRLLENQARQDRGPGPARSESPAGSDQGPQPAAEAVRAEHAKSMLEVAELRGQLQAAQSAIAKAEDAQRAERERGERALAEQRGQSRLEVEKLRAELTAAAEQASSDQRAGAEKAVAAEREESRRQSAQAAAVAETLQAQLKSQAEALQLREAELAAARAREVALAAQLAKGQSDHELLAERFAALEARAATESKALGERERALQKTRAAVRDLALELGGIALREQAWEKARGYLEQAADVDPRSGEAWYGLGEALFQLGQFDKSKQMYDKAKQIY